MSETLDYAAHRSLASGRFGRADLLATLGLACLALLTPLRNLVRQAAPSTAAIATAVASTFELFSPATQMRPERST
jgi:hypothetical protein